MKEKKKSSLFSSKKKETPVKAQSKVESKPVSSLDPFIDLHGTLQNPHNHLLQERLKEAIFVQLQIAMETKDVGGYQAQMLAEMHRRWICLFWKEGTYTKTAHMTLANAYISDLRFANWYDKRVGKGGAQFLRDSVEIYVFRGGVLPEPPAELLEQATEQKTLGES